MARATSKLVGAGLILAFLMAAGGAGGQPEEEEELPPRDPNDELPPITSGEENRIARLICECADEAEQPAALTPIVMRFCAASKAYPTHAWPPIPEDPDSVREAWETIVDLVGEFFEDPLLFRQSRCLTFELVPVGPGPGPGPGPGEVVAELDVDVSAICEPPFPQSVPVRIRLAEGGQYTGEGYAAQQDAWLPFMGANDQPQTWNSVDAARDGSRALVLAFANALCDQPVTPPIEPGEPVPWQFAPASLPGYPWEAPLIHRGGDGKHFPTPGMFFLVRDPLAPTDGILALDSILGIARAALASGFAMAGAPRALGDIPDAMVLAYVDLIACSPWNDAAYGTNNVQLVGGSPGRGPHGRGINMNPRHRDNVAELAAGNPAVRSTFLNGIEDANVPGADKWAQLWLPPIRLDLLELGSVSTLGHTWSTGDSVIVPPPVVWNHGVAAAVSPPGGWGCP
jgi:hypothetical protein